MPVVLRMAAVLIGTLVCFDDAPQQGAPGQRPVESLDPSVVDLDRDGQKDLFFDFAAVAQVPQPNQPFDTLIYELVGATPDDGVGASLAAVDPALRAQLDLPENQGVVVGPIASGGPADQVGLKPNDILLALGEDPIGKPEDLTEGLKKSGDEARELTLIRDGKKTSIRVKGKTRVILAPAGAEKPGYYIGVQTTPADATLRAHLELPADSGLVVNEVVADSPAAQAGLQKGDILLKLDNHPLPDAETLGGMIQTTEGKATKLTLLRGGKSQVITVTPAPRPQQAEPTPAEAFYRARIPGGPSLPGQYLLPRGSWGRSLVPRQPLFAGHARSYAPLMPGGAGPDRTEELARQVEELRKAVETLNQELRKRDR